MSVETKFFPRAIKSVLVDFSSSGNILWHSPPRKFLCSKHFRFNAKSVYKDEFKSQTTQNSEISEDNDLETISFENNDSETVNIIVKTTRFQLFFL